MEKIVECIMNFSEGRRAEVIDAICDAITSVPGVFVLDREMDADHHRAVVTFIGPPEQIGNAAFEATRVATDKIDLTVHRGQHPRLGATDVVPFVPVRGVSMAECVGIAETTGRRIADELQIPVYLYEEAARVPERRDLAVVRKGEFEALSQEISSEPRRKPDFGQARIHPTAGATVVGARMPLVAYNIYLDTHDIRVAKEIARAIRHSSGGLRYVKALGFEIRERMQAQVSMNLTNYEGSPIFRVFEMVRAEAERFGARIVSSEIVGLVPQAALNQCAEHYLKLEKFSPDLILENRIAQAVDSPAAPLSSFLSHLAGPDPTPGGGSVAALAAALAAALGEMTCGVTIGKKGFERHEAVLKTLAEEFRRQRLRGQQLVQDDADAFDGVLAAYRLPRASDAEKQARRTAVAAGLRRATEVPLETARTALAVAGRLVELAAICNPNAVSDAGVGAAQAKAAVLSAGYNIRINLSSLDDQTFRAATLAELESLQNEADRLVQQIHARVMETIERQ